MEERTGHIADYFVVAGLPDNPEPVDEDYCEGLNPNVHNIDPITDITVIFPGLGELVPRGFQCVETTPSGYPANLNSGSIRSPEVYLCYRRGKDKPPLVDIGVMYEGKERVLADAEVVISTPEGRPANVNNSSAKTFLTYRRAAENMPCNELVVTDVCVILQNKGERPPHAFCVINKNLNKGLMGCDVYLCYKKSMNRPPLLSYKAAVLLRYPPVDRRGLPFPTSVAMFCMPMCATIECWPKIAQQPRPVFSTFVLTLADGTEKIYGAAVTFYEKYPEERLSEEQMVALGMDKPGDKDAKGVHVNKCICVLSHYPFFDSFRTFLLYLTLMCRCGPHEVPIERYISHLLEEVPFPSPSRQHILFQLSPTQNVLFSHPHDSPLSKSGASFRLMLNNLGPDNCLLVLLLLLTEQKILIHSLRPDVLTAVAEAVAHIIFPFYWQCPYIPLCPLGLCAVLQAPVPFLIGVDSRFFDLYELPSDVTCIDLDTNTITVSEDKRNLLNAKLLAKKPARILKHTLEVLQEKVYYLGKTQAKSRAEIQDNVELGFQLKRRERMLEMEIQEAFLRFMTSVLKGYRSFLLPITKAPTIGATDASSLFDFQGFLRSRDRNYQKFYQLMLKTQMFIRFIEERSFVSAYDIDAGMAFFDECVDKVCQDDGENIRLIDFHESSVSDRTVFVMPPDAVGLPPNQTYFYDSIFKCDESLFGNVRLKSDSLDRVVQSSIISAPGSPIARRTKQEIKSSQKNARKYSEQPMQWAKYLLSTCYSLWFIHLPSYITVAPSKHMALCLAYEMLVRMAKSRLQPADEVCYRVVMQLCGLYSQPVMAVKVLFEMKRCGITPNAITYGFYNRAVLEAQWPSNVTNSSQLMWNKLRNVIDGVARFRAAGKMFNARSRGFSQSTEDVDRISTGSGASMDSQNQGKVTSQKSLSTAATATATGLSQQNTQQRLPADGKSSISQDSVVPLSSSGMPTRISSSSDVGYGSMNEQKVTDTETEPDEDGVGGSNGNVAENNKTGSIWGKMGQSLDSFVKSSVSGLVTVASLASDTSYYSPGALIMSGYRGDYGGQDEYEDEVDADTYDESRPVVPTRRLDFNDEDEVDREGKSDTMRLLRSVSFGNDTQIMSKLQELKHEMVKANGLNKRVLTSSTSSGGIGGGAAAAAAQTGKPSSPFNKTENKHRSGSEESSGSLETKVNQFYESNNSRDGSLEKSQSSNSREVTPVEEEAVGENVVESGKNADNSLSVQFAVPKSPSIQIRSRENLVMNSKDVSPCSPARTPVTQNDPLGALSTPASPEHNAAGGLPPRNRPSPKRACSEGFIGHMLTPPRASGGNHNGGKDLSGTGFASKSFHRSSTLPNYSLISGETNGSPTGEDKANLAACSGMSGGSSNNVVSSISAISSSLKNPFGRYSPARLSLRKAGANLIESTLGNKKAEALMEGFSQLKSVAAVTARKKLDEFKEVIATSGGYPAGRNGPFGEEYREPGEGSDGDGLEPGDNQWASVSEAYLDQLLTTDGSTRASFASADLGHGHIDTSLSSSTQSLLIDTGKLLGGYNARKDQQPIALEVSMTTCSLCHNCNSLLFDEEIMAGWTAEDSNLNTKCPHCKKWEVPFLEVTVRDFRHYPMALFLPTLQSAHSIESVNTAPSHSRRASVNVNPGISASQPAGALGKQSGGGGGNTETNPSESKEKQQEDESKAKKDIVNNGTISSINGDIQQRLDPLGVLEEKSRKNSPEPEENPAPTQPSSLCVPKAAGEDKSLRQLPPPVPAVILNGAQAEPVIVPYLSPLVLRKELENVLEHEGDSCLLQGRFVDEHPILYWNLLWFFQRADLTSHIKGLTLDAKSTKPTSLLPRYNLESGEVFEEEKEKFGIHPSWEHADHRNVAVCCKWDNPKFHEQLGTPLYLQYLKQQKEREAGVSSKTEDESEKNTYSNAKLISDVLKSVQRNQLSQTCPLLLFHYHKEGRARHYPTYRDILFVALVALNRETFDSYGYGFDRDYREAYSRHRNAEEYESMAVGDTPPSDAAIFCRRFFRDLELP